MSLKSQQKIDELQDAEKIKSSSRVNEANCMNSYTNSLIPKQSPKQLDLFSGLNETVKVKIITMQWRDLKLTFKCLQMIILEYQF